LGSEGLVETAGPARVVFFDRMFPLRNIGFLIVGILHSHLTRNQLGQQRVANPGERSGLSQIILDLLNH
jgi:hypothetical protein